MKVCPGMLMADSVDVWIFLYVDVFSSGLYDINFFNYRTDEEVYFDNLQLCDLTTHAHGGWIGGKVIG